MSEEASIFIIYKFLLCDKVFKCIHKNNHIWKFKKPLPHLGRTFNNYSLIKSKNKFSKFYISEDKALYLEYSLFMIVLKAS